MTENQFLKAICDNIFNYDFIKCSMGAPFDTPTDINRSNIDDVLTNILNDSLHEYAPHVGLTMICHENMLQDILNLYGFIGVSRYCYGDIARYRNEIGIVGNVRIVMTNHKELIIAKSSFNNEDVYQSILVVRKMTNKNLEYINNFNMKQVVGQCVLRSTLYHK